MRKFISSMLLTLAALAGVQANAAMYIVGADPFGSWNLSNAMEMTASGDVYTATATLSGTVGFIFTDVTTSWDEINSGSHRYGPTGGDTNISTGTEIQSQLTGDNGCYYVAADGECTFTFNTTTKKFSVTVAGEPTFGGTIYISKNSTGNIWAWDSGGNYATTDWPGNIAISSLSTATVSGTEYYKFTFSHTGATGLGFLFNDGTSNGKKSDNIDSPTDQKYYTYTGGTTYTLADFGTVTEWNMRGVFNSWGEAAMTEQADGTWTITQAISAGEGFKFYYDGTWYGGDTGGDAGNDEVTYGIHSGWCTDIPLSNTGTTHNFSITPSGTYTFTLNPTTMTVSVTGFSETPTPVTTTTWTVKGSWDSWAAALAMTDNGDGTVSLTRSFAEGDEFKVVGTTDGTDEYYGLPADGESYWVTPPTASALTLSTGTKNLYMAAAGTWKLTFNTTTHALTITSLPACPVTVKSGIANGTVTVDKSTASAGETVTITATPAAGYKICKDKVEVQITSPAEIGQAPRRVAVGDYVTVEGEDGYYYEAVQYTFSMVDYPLGVQVSAEFEARESYDITLTYNDEQGTMTSDPEGSAVEGSTVTVTLAGKGFYEVNTVTAKDADNNDVELTAGDNGTYTFTMPGSAVTVTATYVLPTLTLKGSFDSWGNGAAMTRGADGKFTITRTLDAGAEIKFVYHVTGDTWLGPESNGNFVVTSAQVVNQTPLTLITESGENNFKIPVDGTWTFTVDVEENTVVISGTWPFNAATVVKTRNVESTEGGSVSLDRNNGVYRNGETVTVTVTPVSNAIITYTVGSFGVTYGDGQTVSSDDITVSGNTYTFPMPAGDATITVNFTANQMMYLVGSFNSWGTSGDTDTREPMTKNDEGNWVITRTLPAGAQFKLRDQDDGWVGYNGESSVTIGSDACYGVTGNDVVTPNNLPTVASGEGKNFYVAQAGEYVITYYPNGNYITVAGNWTFNVTETHNAGGTVTLDKSSAANGETVTVTVAPNEGYQYTITANNGDVTLTQDAADENKYTFTVTDNDVEMNVEFSLIPRLFLQGTYNNWGQSTALEFTHNADGTWTATQEMTPAEIENVGTGVEFKLTNEVGTWIGAQSNGDFWVTPAMLGQALTLVNGDEGQNFFIPQAGVNTWTFTVNAERTTVTVTGTWKYAVNLTTNNGEATVSATTAAASDVVTVTVGDADDDYEFSDITVTYELNGSQQTIVPAATATEGEYTFAMPAADVTLTVNFTKIPRLFLVGDYNEWKQDATMDEFTKQADGGWKLTKRLDAGQAFKLYDEDANWYGGHVSTNQGDDQVFGVTKDMLGTALTLDTSNELGKNFSIAVAGEWTMTVNADRTTLTITGFWDYAVNVDQNIENGAVQVDKSRANAGETVTVTVTPDTDWSIGEVTVSDGTTTTVIDPVNDVYTFTMPYSDVTVSASFTKSNYVVTLATNEHVTMSVDPATATTDGVNAGKRITVTTTVDNADDFVVTGLDITRATGTGEVSVTDNGDGTFSFNMPMSNITVDAVREAKLHNVVFDANRQWATYYGNYDIEAPENVTVYVATGLNADGTELTVEEIDYIPAGVGVLLYSETPASDITSPLYTGTTGNYTSTLVGSVEPQVISSGYVLYNNTFLLTQAGTLGAHRCYLPGAAAAPSGMPARLNLPRISGGYIDVITAVSNLNGDSRVKSVKYVNAAGRVSDQPFEGVNIVVTTLNDGTVKTVKVIK